MRAPRGKAHNIPELIFHSSQEYQVWKRGSRNQLSDCLLFSHCSCVIKWPKHSLPQRLMLFSSKLMGRNWCTPIQRRKQLLQIGAVEQSAEPPPWFPGTGTWSSARVLSLRGEPLQPSHLFSMCCLYLSSTGCQQTCCEKSCWLPEEKPFPTYNDNNNSFGSFSEFNCSREVLGTVSTFCTVRGYCTFCLLLKRLPSFTNTCCMFLICWHKKKKKWLKWIDAVKSLESKL